jgi:hypothetical protein
MAMLNGLPTILSYLCIETQIAMETLRIEILNPKVRGILQQLAELKLITINSTPSAQERFTDLVKKIRAIDPDGLTMDEIAAETETVRSRRYGKDQKD